MASGDSDGSGGEERQQGEGEEEEAAGEEANQINELVIEDPDALDVDLVSDLESLSELIGSLKLVNV